MPNPGTSDYHRYLAAKKSIDDRSLNPRVWDSLARALPRTRPTDVLELGAGIGSMVQRVIERGLLTDCRYRAVDLEPGNVAEATRRLPPWARERDLSVEEMGEGGLRFSGAGVSMDLSFEAANVVDVLKKPDIRGVYDFVIAQAFLDLVDLDSVLPLIGASLRPEGLIYLCINFDGGTIFDPIIDAELDARIEALYHRTMDERVADGKALGGQPYRAEAFLGVEKNWRSGIGRGPLRLGGLPYYRRLLGGRRYFSPRDHRYGTGGATVQPRARSSIFGRVDQRASLTSGESGAGVHRSSDWMCWRAYTDLICFLSKSHLRTRILGLFGRLPRSSPTSAHTSRASARAAPFPGL